MKHLISPPDPILYFNISPPSVNRYGPKTGKPGGINNLVKIDIFFLPCYNIKLKFGLHAESEIN